LSLPESLDLRFAFLDFFIGGISATPPPLSPLRFFLLVLPSALVSSGRPRFYRAPAPSHRDELRGKVNLGNFFPNLVKKTCHHKLTGKWDHEFVVPLVIDYLQQHFICARYFDD
jgi:hypothetical protein